MRLRVKNQCIFGTYAGMTDDGKRVNISLFFNITLNKPLLSKKKIIKGEVKSFGELTGTFSLNDFDILIENTQLDLIERLNIELKQKI